MTDFVVVSYFTKEYAEDAQCLRWSCYEFLEKYEIVPVQCLGDWMSNTQYKPVFLMQMLEKYKPSAIVWVDADAEFKAYPDLFNEITEDVGIHFRRGSEPLTGTLFLQNNDRVWRLLQEWVRLNRESPNQYEHKHMGEAIAGLKGFTVRVLPASYCKIFDAEDMGKEEVIVHHQASRRLRFIERGKGNEIVS